MNIYHYIPRPEGLTSPHWKASTHKGDCYVYADTIREAASYAYREFGIAVAKPPIGQEIPSNPWAQG